VLRLHRRHVWLFSLLICIVVILAAVTSARWAPEREAPELPDRGTEIAVGQPTPPTQDAAADHGLGAMSGSPASPPLAAPVTSTTVLSAAVRAADGRVVFLDDAAPLNRASAPWPREKVYHMRYFYEHAITMGFAGRRGFGDVACWSEAFGISASHPIYVIYDTNHALGVQPTVGWDVERAVPVITYGSGIRTKVPSQGIELAMHELAHIWDGAHGWALSATMVDVVENPANYPTARARNGGPKEDFADSVVAFFRLDYATNVRWSDDDIRFRQRYGTGLDEVWRLDRYDYVALLLEGATVESLRDQGRGDGVVASPDDS
jgi:hypothetical protein